MQNHVRNVAALGGLLTAVYSLTPLAAMNSMEELKVWGEAADSRSADYTNPTSLLLPEDMLSINAATTEDLMKYESSLVVRRRFIGDANGTLGIRGSNMFQTSRSMVFADGVPLHYFLQSRWNGAPRWTMVSASEIARIEVIYGPFSAEYSGNAMGGVVEIETRLPQRREFHLDANYFVQSFDEYGFNDSVDGFKGFVSYGDKVGNWSYYLSANKLDNDSQPQSFRYNSGTAVSTEDTASGALRGNDQYGNPVWYYGDSGVERVITDNYKFKLGYDFGAWQVLLNLAYEDRQSEAAAPDNYLRDLAGNPLWSNSVTQQGESFPVRASNFSVSELQRQSLSAGLRLKGELSDSARLEVNLSRFDILRDETRASARNPADPLYTLDGQVTDYDDSGWQTAEIKLTLEDVGRQGLQLVSGVRHEAYSLNLDVYSSDNYRSGNRSQYSSRFGGETELLALFSQMNWAIDSRWSLALGLRYERFESHSGYFDDDDAATAELDLVHVPASDSDKLSPKFSVGFQPTEDWQLRYSLAKAYRFAIVEELFSQYQAYNTIAQANPELQPEDGLHHNLMLERRVEGGFVRLNLFQESIEDAIESQSTTLPGGTSLRTFIPIDEVQTLGVELIANRAGMLLPNLDVRFNLAWTDSEIVRNDADPGIEGNVFPRMPKWRSNLLATYHLTRQWDVGGSVQYASDSFGSSSNNDTEDNVFGAQDGYTRIGLKTTYGVSDNLKLGFGVDNLTNEIAYVAHPWPGRTLYMNVGYDF